MELLHLLHKKIAFKSIRPAKVKRDDIVIVFLHEALGSIGQWRNFPEMLCKELELDGFVYERQGHGSSSPFSEARTALYLHDYAWQELPEIIETVFPIEKKLILVGHSDGGTIALLYAARYPKRVIATITMAAHVINEPETINGIYPAIEAFKAGKLDGLKKYHGEKTLDLFNAWSQTWLSEDFKTWDICQDIRALESPVLSIQGANDQYGTLKQLDLIENNISTHVKTHLLPNCGHHPQLDQERRVLETICEWLTLD
jgi:pimeloyl-ACP methyl ester carboxylesterase